MNRSREDEMDLDGGDQKRLGRTRRSVRGQEDLKEWRQNNPDLREGGRVQGASAGNVAERQSRRRRETDPG